MGRRTNLVLTRRQYNAVPRAKNAYNQTYRPIKKRFSYFLGKKLMGKNIWSIQDLMLPKTTRIITRRERLKSALYLRFKKRKTLFL